MKVVKPILIAAVLASMLAITHQQSREVILANEQQYAERVLREMVRDAEFTPTDRGYRISRAGEPVGYIHATSTDQGYNGKIELLVAVNNDSEVLAVRVTRHKETPGLGDKIDLQVSDWITQFDARPMADTDWRLKPEGDFDGITGATITARATVNAVRGVLPP